MRNKYRFLLFSLIFSYGIISHGQDQEIGLAKTSLGKNVYRIYTNIEGGFELLYNFDTQTSLQAHNIRIIDSNTVTYTVWDSTDNSDHTIWANSNFELLLDLGSNYYCSKRINDSIFIVGNSRNTWTNSYGPDSVTIMNGNNKEILGQYFEFIFFINDFIVCADENRLGTRVYSVYDLSGTLVSNKIYTDRFETKNAIVLFDSSGYLVLMKDRIYQDDSNVVVPFDNFSWNLFTDYIITTAQIDSIVEDYYGGYAMRNIYSSQINIFKTDNMTPVSIAGFSDFEYLIEDLVIVKKNGLQGVYNLNGKQILPVEYNLIKCPYDDDKATAVMAMQGKEKYYYSYQVQELMLIPKKAIPQEIKLPFPNDELVFPGRKHYSLTPWNYYEELKYFLSDTPGLTQGIIYRYGNLWGLLDTNYTKMTEPIYDFLFDAGSKPCPHLIVCRDTLFGIINLKGEEVIPMKYNLISPTYDQGFYYVKQNGKMGLIDTNDSDIIPPTIYTEIIAVPRDSIISNLWTVKKGDDWGVIDNGGNVIIKPRYNYEIIYLGGGIFECIYGLGELDPDFQSYREYKFEYVSSTGEPLNLPPSDLNCIERRLTYVSENLFLLECLTLNPDVPDDKDTINVIRHYDYINKQGDLIFAQEFEVCCDFVNGEAFVVTEYSDFVNGKAFVVINNNETRDLWLINSEGVLIKKIAVLHHR